MRKILIFLLLASACFLAGGVFAVGQVDINTASLQQLDEITGVGPAIGQKIINARPFSSLDDLLRVSGIGPKTLQKIKDQGVAYVENLNDKIQNSKPISVPTPPPAPAPVSASPIVTSKPEALPNVENFDISKETEAELASLSQTANPWFLFFTVLATTIILATVVLIIKIRFIGVTKP